MKKISTLYKKDPNNLNLVINELDIQNEWVIKGFGIPTQKFNGTATAIISGQLFKRYDNKKGKQLPGGAIPCQDADPITGHHPYWILCKRNNPEDKYHWIAFDALENKADGTYELCGEKIQCNEEHITGYKLIKHGSVVLSVTDFSFEGLKTYLSNPENDIEGIVFHHKTDNELMCKIRKSDFGIKR